MQSPTTVATTPPFEKVASAPFEAPEVIDERWVVTQLVQGRDPLEKGRWTMGVQYGFRRTLEIQKALLKLLVKFQRHYPEHSQGIDYIEQLIRRCKPGLIEKAQQSLKSRKSRSN